MTERYNAKEKRASEYASTAAEIAGIIKDHFPDTPKDEYWESEEAKRTNDSLIAWGYSGADGEAVLIVEHDGLGNNWETHYIFGKSGVRKEGVITRFKRDKKHTPEEAKYTGEVGLKELRIVAKIARDPIANIGLIGKLPLLPRA